MKSSTFTVLTLLSFVSSNLQVLDRVPIVWALIQYYFFIVWDAVQPYLVAAWTFIYPLLKQTAELIVHYATAGWIAVSPYVNQTWNSLQQTFR